MIEVRFHPTPATLEKDELHGATAVVIDVLRATSTIIAAIERGASHVIPVESIEAASRLAGAGDRGGKLLANFFELLFGAVRLFRDFGSSLGSPLRFVFPNINVLLGFLKVKFICHSYKPPIF